MIGPTDPEFHSSAQAPENMTSLPPTPGPGPESLPRMPEMKALPPTPAMKPLPRAPRSRAFPWIIFRATEGYRLTILTGNLLACLVLLTNLVLMISFAPHAPDPQHPWAIAGKRTLFEGSCRKVGQLNTVAHGIINILSTLLLGASNFAMQCLTAPTRAEVDAAHANRRWLDIGVMSLRNLRFVRKRQVMLWTLLLVTSLPFHFFYNSAVYPSTHPASYTIFSTNSTGINLTSADGWLGNDFSLSGAGSNSDISAVAEKLRTEYQSENLDKLNNIDCIKEYTQAFQNRRGNLILVTNSSQPTETFRVSSVDVAAPNPYNWMCYGKNRTNAPCNVNDCQDQRSTYREPNGHPGLPCLHESNYLDRRNLSKNDREDWAPFGKKVQYCLSEIRTEKCALQFSIGVVSVVVVFNLMKAILLACAFRTISDDALITVGDGIASFLSREDSSTIGVGAMDKSNVKHWSNQSGDEMAIPLEYNPKQKSWASHLKKQWLLTFSLLICAMVVAFTLLAMAIQTSSSSVDQILSIPFGAFDPQTTLWPSKRWHIPGSGSLAFFMNVFIANAPQTLLTGIYFFYNALFTRFLLGRELSYFSKHRKGLRVSRRPVCAQRSTFFLQIPYRAALPLNLLSCLIHWLCSESFFLVSLREPIQGAAGAGTESFKEVMTCGYSASATTGVLSVGWIMLLILIPFGYGVWYPNGMPVASTCSAAISAMCHVSKSERGEEAAYLPVQWGVVVDDDWNGVSYEKCTFSSQEVSFPIEGKEYGRPKQGNRLYYTWS